MPKRRPTGWKRYFLITTHKLGGPEDDCWSALLFLQTELTPIRSTTATTEAEAAKEMEWYARRQMTIVKACMSMEAEVVKQIETQAAKRSRFTAYLCLECDRPLTQEEQEGDMLCEHCKGLTG